MIECPSCGAEALEIDVKCGKCGHALGATGAHRMLGQVMLGHYELVDVLGQGGMSVVFKGRHKLTEQEVALKILPPELAAHSQVKSRFLEEAKALAALDHPNIVHLYNFGQENGFFVLAMQFVQGQTWERMILESKRLPWVQSVRITIDVLRALEYAHGRGVIHRDMKPSNVLVRNHDGAATVMDFGIAKMTTSTRLTAEGQTMGTVRYMSPEQVRGHEVTHHTDIYSLGATMYESLVGDTPFDGNTHFEIMTKHLSEVPKRPSVHGVELPSDVEDALMRALAKKPTDRWENARDMRKILEAALRRADVGLVETQKIQPDDVASLRSDLKARPASPAPTSLSDVLEPEEPRLTAPERPANKRGAAPTPAASQKQRSLVPWIALIVLIGAGGTAAALVFLKKKQPETKPVDTAAVIDGVVLQPAAQFGPLSIQTTGAVTPAEVEAAYRAARTQIEAAAKKVDLHDGQKHAPLEVHAPAITQILAVPQIALCAPSAYPVGVPPMDCRTTLATLAVGKGGVQRIMVAEDRATIGKALAVGTAKAVCEFPAEADKARNTEICEIQKQFSD